MALRQLPQPLKASGPHPLAVLACPADGAALVEHLGITWGSDELHLELAEVWHGGRGLCHAAEGDTGLVGWHSAVAHGGAQLLQHHQHLLLQSLLVLLLALQAALPLQHRMQRLAQLLDLCVYSVELLGSGVGTRSRRKHCFAPSKVLISRARGVQWGGLCAGIFDLE